MLIGRSPRRGFRQDHRGHARREGLSNASALYRRVLQGAPWISNVRSIFRRSARAASISPIGRKWIAKGNVEGWIASLLDITEQKGLESELRSLSEKLEAEVERRTLERDRIWNVSEDLLGVSNFEGYFLSMNPAWSNLLGWSEDEIKSMHVSELRHPDDAPAAIAGRAQLAQGVPTVRMENRFRHKDGSWRWLQWTMTANSGLLYVAGRHVTAEKEAAAALERAQRETAHLHKMDAIGQLTGGIAHDFNNLLMIVSGHAQSLKSRLRDAKDTRAVAGHRNGRDARREPDPAIAVVLAHAAAQSDRDRSRGGGSRHSRRAGRLDARQYRIPDRYSGCHLARSRR